MNKKEILKYTKFREEFNFDCKELEVIDQNIYFCGELVQDNEKKYSEGESFINIGYNFKNSLARVLSNLYPLSFKFRGKMVSSIEGVLQGIKYKDKKTQNLVLAYSGLDAYHTRGANTLDFWWNTGFLYWQGKEIKRNEREYQIFLDELYLSAIKNPIYKQSLLATKDKYLLHHIGSDNSRESVLTRKEYEERLNTLREYIKENSK